MENLTAPKYEFNANYLTLYTEVLLGHLQRLEETKPDSNTDYTNGHNISNQSLLIGFIFQQLIGCKSAEEAIQYYKDHKEEVDEKYMVDRLIRKIPLSQQMGKIIKPVRRFQLALFMYYESEWDTEDLKKLLFTSKNPSKLKSLKNLSDIIDSEDEG